ncbi:MAG: DUF1836 domain-containing protein [Clostridiales bacterium]|nr:DUF1836 domain-containing protein [Clostridiales bacterium]MCD7802689.1 DUF1836 domain-containing protein [Clostridiales bacterium]
MNSLEQLVSYRCPPFSEYPAIPLYMDQVISLLTQAVNPFYPDTEAPVTASMINNYVKLKVLPAPVQKKYSRNQVVTLYIIFLLKQVLSMEEIRLLLQREFDPEDMEPSYRCFCAQLEGALSELAGDSIESFSGAHPLMEAAIRSLVYRRYVAVLLREPTAEDETEG